MSKTEKFKKSVQSQLHFDPSTKQKLNKIFPSSGSTPQQIKIDTAAVDKIFPKSKARSVGHSMGSHIQVSLGEIEKIFPQNERGPQKPLTRSNTLATEGGADELMAPIPAYNSQGKMRPALPQKKKSTSPPLPEKRAHGNNSTNFSGLANLPQSSASSSSKNDVFSTNSNASSKNMFSTNSNANSKNNMFSTNSNANSKNNMFSTNNNASSKNNMFSTNSNANSKNNMFSTNSNANSTNTFGLSSGMVSAETSQESFSPTRLDRKVQFSPEQETRTLKSPEPEKRDKKSLDLGSKIKSLHKKASTKLMNFSEKLQNSEEAPNTSYSTNTLKKRMSLDLSDRNRFFRRNSIDTGAERRSSVESEKSERRLSIGPNDEKMLTNLALKFDEEPMSPKAEGRSFGASALKQFTTLRNRAVKGLNNISDRMHRDQDSPTSFAASSRPALPTLKTYLLFTKNLEEIDPSYCASLDGAQIPIVFIDCLDYLNKKKCYKEQGIFRISGSMAKVNELINSYENREPVDLLSEPEEANIASLLKRLLRDMPASPLAPLIQVLTSKASDEFPSTPSKTVLKSSISEIPLAHRVLLTHLFDLLMLIAQNSATSWMDVHNLSVVFSATLKCDDSEMRWLITSWMED